MNVNMTITLVIMISSQPVKFKSYAMRSPHEIADIEARIENAESFRLIQTTRETGQLQ